MSCFSTYGRQNSVKTTAICLAAIALGSVWPIATASRAEAQERFDYDPRTGEVFHSRRHWDGSWKVDAYDVRTGRRERMDYGTDGVLRGYNRRDGAWEWDGRTYLDDRGTICETGRGPATCY